MDLSLNAREVAMIAVGTSAGGVDALNQLFRSLPEDFEIPLLVILHLAPTSGFIADAFAPPRGVSLKEVEDKEEIKPHTVYFAPPNYHVLIERDLTFSLTVEDLVNYSRPSIDVSFASLADALGPFAAAALFTGANEDGALGLEQITLRGGLSLVQDPSTAQSACMPASAIAKRKPCGVGSIKEISQVLAGLKYIVSHPPVKGRSLYGI